MLLSGLARCSAGVPPDVLAGLRRQANAAAVRSLAQIAEVGRLAGAFARADIRVIALKGVVLSAQLFSDPGLRDARDIDFLVDPEKFGEAAAVLAAAGYARVGATPTPRQETAYRRWIKDVEFAHAATNARIELHHRLADNPRLIDCDFATLWSERAEVRLGEATVPALGPARLAPYLCAHGASHGWERLRWLIDLAAALREPGGAAAALAAAEADGLGAAMGHAVMRAHDWLGLPVAAGDLAAARSRVSTASSPTSTRARPGTGCRAADPQRRCCAPRCGSGSTACRSNRAGATGRARPGANGSRRRIFPRSSCPTRCSGSTRWYARSVGWCAARSDSPPRMDLHDEDGRLSLFFSEMQGDFR
jgi:hypothetical protein